jgi:hypothetical protein
MGQIEPFPGGAGNPDLNRSVELHMQRGRDVTENKGATRPSITTPRAPASFTSRVFSSTISASSA